MAAALGRTKMFGCLGWNELQALAGRALVRRLARGDVHFVADEPASGMFVIVSGAIRAFRVSAEGREQVIHVERAGATLAEVPVFDDGAYPATASAEEDSVVLFIDKPAFKQCLLAHPQIALAALKVLAGRLRGHVELVETVSLLNVGRRLARFLVGDAQARGTWVDGRMELTLSLSHQQIAARVGSVREVVTRALARLQKDGLIVVQGDRLIITDYEHLVYYAEAS
jgi:CRP/FNR family transcriptional regulator